MLEFINVKLVHDANKDKAADMYNEKIAQVSTAMDQLRKQWVKQKLDIEITKPTLIVPFK